MKENLKDPVNIVTSTLETWYEAAVSALPNFIVAIVTMIAFVFIARTVRKLARRVMGKSVDNEALRGLIGTMSYFAILAIGLFVSLGILHLDKTVTSLLAGAGVIGLALGFAFQDIAANFISGIMIAFRQPYRIEDIVEVGGLRGVVKEIGLRTTRFVTFEGIEIFVPNKMMFTEPLKNFTTTPKRRLDISVGVSYGDDLRKVEKIIKTSIEDMDGRIDDEEIEVFYKEFGASSINLDVRVWIEYPADKNYLKFRHEAIMRIKEAFDDNGIDIPFPIRTLDFGIKGGESLQVPLRSVVNEAGLSS